MERMQFLDVLADAAAAAILPHFRSRLDEPGSLANKLEKDQGFDPVTIADKNAEAAMRDLIIKQYPEHGILGEEFDTIREDAERVWILDPIDGTRAFISGLPVWGVLIGHRYQERAELGMMAQPFTGERFVGDGKTAWMTRPETVTPLQTRPCTSLKEATLFTTSPHLITNDKGEKYRAIEDEVQLYRYGVDCYAFAMLAAGHVDIVIEDGLKPFDIAALIPVIEGAGGRVTTWQGENAVHGGSIIACGDPSLHDKLLARLA